MQDTPPARHREWRPCRYAAKAAALAETALALAAEGGAISPGATWTDDAAFALARYR